jgi:hypothetical protein
MIWALVRARITFLHPGKIPFSGYLAGTSEANEGSIAILDPEAAGTAV